RELELLFRAIVFQPSTPILLADDQRHYREASVGASLLLGLRREEIIGRSLDDFAEPSVKPVIPELWQDFLKDGEQAGTLRLRGADGAAREVEYTAKSNVLPVRHVLVLRDKGAASQSGASDENSPGGEPPKWVQDFALFLLSPDGRLSAWYEGSERIYGYLKSEVIGQNVSSFDSDKAHRFAAMLTRAAKEGHFGTEAWQVRKDGSRFWANIIMVALKDDAGVVRGFGCVVRDFSDRHERDEKVRRSRTRLHIVPSSPAIVGIVTGEFDGIPEANDAFLELVGYSRDDLQAGLLNWPRLTPPEYRVLDDVAHEEGLRFGACTPFEKELLRKDGSRVAVLVATAVLKLSPFRWITFVTDLRERDRAEGIDEDVVEITHNFEEMIGASAIMKRVMAQ